MSRLILPSRKIWTPPQRQRGYVVLDGYRAGGGGDPDYAHTVLQIHPGGSDGGTSFVDTSSYARTVTRVNAAAIATDTDAPGGTALNIADTTSKLQVAHISADNARAGAFMVDCKIKLFAGISNTGMELPAIILADGTTYTSYEWGVGICQQWILFYYGARGVNQSTTRFYYPGSLDMSTTYGGQVSLSLGRDADGDFGAWVNGTRCTDYQTSPLSSGVSFGSVITGTYTNAVDLGEPSIATMQIGSHFVDVGGGVHRHLNEIRYVVGQCRDVSSNYTPRTTPFPDS